MATLRDRERGCPWDLEQTFATIAPYTIEEAYEVADAIERNDLAELKDELGDLLFQVVFHARMAEEAGAFAFADVARAICDKMLRRHPHVFGDQRVADSAEQTKRWEEIKREERASSQRASGVLDDVPVGLPALTRATQARQARGVGRLRLAGRGWSARQGRRGDRRARCGSRERWPRRDRRGDGRSHVHDRELVPAPGPRSRDLLALGEPEVRDAVSRRRAGRDAGGRDWQSYGAAELDLLWERAKARSAR